MSYDKCPTKLAHRASVLAYAQYSRLRHPILYIDDTKGGATSYFLAHGVKREMLVPVNYDKADSIHTRTGVHPLKSDMNTALCKPGTCPARLSFTWLDLQSTTLPLGSLRGALERSEFVGITLSTRCKGVEAVLKWAAQAVRSAGGVLVESGCYAGVSGLPNMVRIIAAPHVTWTRVVKHQRLHHTGGVRPPAKTIKRPTTRSWCSRPTRNLY